MMYKSSITKYSLLFFIILPFVFIGCSSLNFQNLILNKSIEKPNSLVELKEEKSSSIPDWISVLPKSDNSLYVVGYGKVTDRNSSTRRAIADAKENISKWLQNKVQTILVQKSADEKSGFRTTNQNVAIEISRSVTNASLSGIEQKDIWQDEDGGYWVLMEVSRSIPIKSFELELNKIINIDENNSDELIKHTLEDFDKSLVQ